MLTMLVLMLAFILLLIEITVFSFFIFIGLLVIMFIGLLVIWPITGMSPMDYDWNHIATITGALSFFIGGIVADIVEMSDD